MTLGSRVRIVGDGTSAGTKVFDAETGAPLPAVQRLEFSLDAGGLSLCKVTQLFVVHELNIETDAERVVNGIKVPPLLAVDAATNAVSDVAESSAGTPIAVAADSVRIEAPVVKVNPAPVWPFPRFNIKAAA